MLFVYLISLFTSAGLTGLFVRAALGEQGYVPGFGAGVMLACGVAALYAGAQGLYLALVRFVWPTRTNWPLLGECLSHAATLVFVPYLTRMSVPMHPALEPFKALIFFALFVVLHGAIKIVAFYAILRSEPGPRGWNLVWTVASTIAILSGIGMFSSWLSSIENARPRAPEAISNYQVASAHANARAVPEGSVLAVNVSAGLGQCLTLACAVPEELEADSPLESVFFTIDMRGETATKFTAQVNLKKSEWTYFRVPADQVPRKMESCQIRWTEEKESRWRQAIGILPVLSSNRELLVAGPHVHEVLDDESAPNFVVIVIDGLGTDRVSSMGATRATTPNIDRLGQSAVTYPFTYTPAPDAGAACMTLLTGLSPLRHGYLEKHRGPLSTEYKTLPELLRAKRYAVAAFTEGEMWGDLTFESDFSRGFDVFDDGYRAEAPATVELASQSAAATVTPALAGSELTVKRARDWLDAHQDVSHMLFIRLSELRDARVRDRYGSTFTPDPATATSNAVYNSVILYLDRNIGELVNYIKQSSAANKTCIVLTSTRGAYNQESPVLADWTLRVPLLISAPGIQPTKRNELTPLEDVAPTLAKLAGVSLSPFAAAADLINSPTPREPISMIGNPLVLSIRDRRFRLVWSTQRAPFTMESVGPPAAPALYDLERSRADRPMQDIAPRNPQMTRRWVEKLEQYVAMQSEGWQSPPAAATLR